MAMTSHEANSESYENLQLFIAQAPAPIAMFDCDMHYLAASRRWVEDYGLEGLDILGHSHYEILSEIPESWRQVHRRALQGEWLLHARTASTELTDPLNG